MKIKALRNILFSHKIVKENEICDIKDSDGVFLIEHGFAVSAEEPETIATQIGLDSPAFGFNDTDIKITKKRGRPKKNA